MTREEAAKWLSDNRPFIGYLTRRAWRDGLWDSWEDACQEVAAIILARLRYYRPERGAVTTFLRRAVPMEVSKIAQARHAQKRTPPGAGVSSLDAMKCAGDEPAARFDVAALVERRELVAAVLARLSKRLRRAVKLVFLAGEPVNTVARRLGYASGASLSNRMGEKFAKIRAELAA